MEPVIGLRVVRGPDWEWEDQDGGEGFVGTVAGLEEGGGGVIVQWDMGQRCRYRCGRDNKFDLRILDSGPSGHSFSKYRCHVCRTRKVYGVVWRCLHCSEYYLCSPCYLSDLHCSLHRFTCLLDRDQKQYRVPPRVESRRSPVSGLFPGAEVVRGVDWRWRDQDGGEGKRGRVVEVSGWSNEGASGTECSVVVVVWENGNRKRYRAGHKGKVDVRCVSPGSGGFYFPEHLPVLGQEVGLPNSGDIVTGDRVKYDTESGTLDSLMENPGMAEKIGLMLDHVGTVNTLRANGDIVVRYPGNSLIPVTRAALKKVDIPVFEPGDVVKMISDIAEAYRLQQGHGEWNDDMALCLGQVGRVVKTSGDTSVMVSIAGYRWMLNPHSLLQAEGEDLSPDTKSKPELLGLGLSLLIDSVGPGILLHATSQGDLATVQAFLEKNPHQVNVMEQGKTAIHVAVEEARIDILRVILKFKPDTSKRDSDGDAPLHGCAFHNATQAAALLLEAGADVNSRNNKRGITPIMIAGAVGHFELLEVMATHHSADVNVQDFQDQTALHHAVSSQRTRAIPILLAAGASLTLVNSNLFAPLMEAASHGSLPGVEDILRKKPDTIDWIRPSDGLTSIHMAGVRNQLFVVRHLALSGCELNSKTELQRTALHTCAIEGNSAIMECLVGFGVDINARDSDGNTVLHIVFVNKNCEPLTDYTPQMNKVQDELNRLPLGSVPVFLTVACFLVQEGGDLRVRNNLGQAPANSCPADKRDIVLNYLNKSNRGEFHGSLRRDRTASGSDNRPKVENSPLASVASDSATAQYSPSIISAVLQGRSEDSSDEEGDRSITSIMEAGRQGMVRGGGVRGSHRERDRVRFLEAERKKEAASHREESHGPSAAEIEQVRKHREAYFSRTAKQRVKEEEEEEERVSENGEVVEGAEPQREKQPAERAAETKTGVSEEDRGAPKPQKTEVPSKPVARSTGGKDGSGGLPQTGGGNSGSVQTKAVQVAGGKIGKQPEDTRQHQAGVKDGANATVACFVCEEPASAKFASCGHTVACKKCAGRAKRCPVCKVLVTGVL